MYAQFPYVVSVYAASPQAAVRAWRKIVRQRPPETSAASAQLAPVQVLVGVELAARHRSEAEQLGDQVRQVTVAHRLRPPYAGRPVPGSA